MSDFISLPGFKDYYKQLLSDVRKHPELKMPPEYVEWTRSEQMEWHWRRHKKLKEIDPVKYYESVESGMTMPVGVVLGVDPATLSYGMFRPCLRKLGSDE
jgi:hypothetical protein